MKDVRTQHAFNAIPPGRIKSPVNQRGDPQSKTVWLK